MLNIADESVRASEQSSTRLRWRNSTKSAKQPACLFLARDTDAMTASSEHATSDLLQKKIFGKAPKSFNVVGVEVGYGVLYLVLLERISEEEIILKKYEAITFDPSLDLEGAAFVAFLKKTLKKFGRGYRNVEFWTVPRLDQTTIHNIKIPRVNAARLTGGVYWELQRRETFLENETVIDFHEDKRHSNKTVMELSCVMVDRSCIDALKQTFSQAGLPLAGISAPSFSLRNLLSLRDDLVESAPVLTCQIGLKATSLSILAEGRLVFTRNISFGLENLAETLTTELDPPPSQGVACQLILEPGKTEGLSPEVVQQQELVPNLLKPILERLIRQIERTIEHFQTNFETAPVGSIFLGGEIAAKPHLFKFLAKRLSPDVFAIDPFASSGLQLGEMLPQGQEERIAFGPACGLALEASKPSINLAYTYQERQTEDNLRKVAVAVTISLIVLAVCLTFIYRSKIAEVKDLVTDQKKLERRLKELGAPLTEASITNQSRKVVELQELRRAATRRYEGMALLSVISRETPDNIKLLNIEIIQGGPSIASPNFQTQGKEAKSSREMNVLTLKGIVNGERADLETVLTIYVARLEKSLLIDQVRVVGTELVSSSSGSGLTFSLQVATKPDDLNIFSKK